MESLPGAGDVASVVIAMGVSASGKSTFGQRLAERMGARFIDGDDLHPASNLRKMTAGQPLDDEDRRPWLKAIQTAMRQECRNGRSLVIACSALKKTYRDLLRDSGPSVFFAFLDLDEATVLERIRQRPAHFMKASMVQSQFATLEVPEGEENTIRLDGEKPVDILVEEFLKAASA